ncbi:MAG: NAD(P)-dependent alcohol dehydrogenase [Saprospiraceae bacterium]|nr:NAD(P)-dependent alcohol dehydrogenase [Lewinella sp.]
MKAIVCTAYGPPEVLKRKEIPKPQPQPDEILIKVYATTVTVADRRVRSFDVPKGAWLPARLALGISKPRRPVLGIELAGMVEAVGRNVTRFQAGDAVFASTLNGFGAYAEYICLKAESPVAHKPENISFAEAAALPIGALTALHYLKKTPIGPGKKILIYGASGSVGTYAVQLARHFGAEITGVCSGANMKLVSSLGADTVIDYTQSDFAARLATYDIVFLAVDKLPFSVCQRILSPSGIYLNATQPLKSPSMLWTSWTSNKKVYVGENIKQTAALTQELKELVEGGKIYPVIDRSYALDQIVEAHRYVDRGHKKGNVVIRVIPS